MGRRRRLLLGALVVGVVVVQHWLHRAAVSQAPARDVSWVTSPEFEEAVRARDAALAARDEATRVVAALNREALAAAVAAKRPAARAPSAPPAAAAAVLVGVASQFAEIAGLKLASIPVAKGGTKPATPPDRRGDDARARATAACFGNATRPPGGRRRRALGRPSLRMYAARPSTRNIRAVTMVREPLGRVVSAWHYRCHNPNWDCFHVPGATQWSERKRADERNRHDATLHVWAASTLCGELRNADLLDLPGCGAAAAARARAYCADA
ncbi:hypothetical protein SO694_00085038 [Aureococcus anophagefferens]|uniref:Sulfotransferase domain-containing protein n=1 Tax=Aureococcus anophagefferens TaxID=44056 RepID=A0ABR1G4G6_AURAN